MGGFKRFLLIFVSLVGLVTLAVLGMPWFGYGVHQLTNLIYVPEFWIVLEVCIGICVVFYVILLGYGLFGRKRVDAIKVMSVDGGEITVTRSAIASQATHIVEALGIGTAKDVEVVATKNKPVDVNVDVLTYESVDVTAEAPVLHEALVTGLSAMCGERLGNINLEFLEPEHGSSLVVPVDVSDEDGGVTSSAADAQDTTAAADSTGDITIPMYTEKSE